MIHAIQMHTPHGGYAPRFFDFGIATATPREIARAGEAGQDELYAMLSLKNFNPLTFTCTNTTPGRLVVGLCL